MNLEDYIIQTFQDHNIIALGEGGHGLLKSHELIRQMFDDPKIQELIDIVIVEFANTDYQEVLDQYIFGEDVAINDLRQVWRESGQPGRLGELPIYFQLLKKIRKINKFLPENKKIRVLAGDPSINWKAIQTLEDWKNQIGYSREKFPAELAIKYGVTQGKKILIIYSESHLTKITDNFFDPNYPSIISTIHQKHSGVVKTIGTIYSELFLADPRLKNLPINSIIDLQEDELGNVSGAHFFQGSLYKDGKEVRSFEKYKTKELFDALLYVGQFDALKRCPMPEPDFDPEYLTELNRRRKIVGMMPIG